MFFPQFGTMTSGNISQTESDGKTTKNHSNMNLQKLPADPPFSNGLLNDGPNDAKDDVSSPSHFIRLKQQESKSVKVYECGICGKEFNHQYTLMRHLPTHTDERKFNCATCGKAFRQMSTLSQHRAIHSSDRPYVCEVCCKTFNRVSTLISHRKTHTGVKPHRCHMCSKSFHQKGNLRNHIFTHTNERPYKCDICEKGFNQMSNLMCHKLKAHQHFDVIPKYTCKICGEDFLKRIGLRQHEQYQHRIGTIEEPPVVAPPKFDYSNAIIVDPIKTEAMRLALESHKTPFALLRPLSGIPVLVRVLPAGSKQLLVPATAEDLKKHGHISITPKSEPVTDDAGENKENEGPTKPAGSVVQIKVPVVATVIQRPSTGGERMNMSVVSPGPADAMHNGGKSGESNYVFTSSLPLVSNSAQTDVKTAPGDKSDNQALIDEFHLFDEHQKILTEQEFNANFELNNQFDFDLQHPNSLANFPSHQLSAQNPAPVNFNDNLSHPIENLINNTATEYAKNITNNPIHFYPITHQFPSSNMVVPQYMDIESMPIQYVHNARTSVGRVSNEFSTMVSNAFQPINISTAVDYSNMVANTMGYSVPNAMIYNSVNNPMNFSVDPTNSSFINNIIYTNMTSAVVNDTPNMPIDFSAVGTKISIPIHKIFDNKDVNSTSDAANTDGVSINSIEVEYTEATDNSANKKAADMIVIEEGIAGDMIVEKVEETKARGPAKDMPLLCDFGDSVDK